MLRILTEVLSVSDKKMDTSVKLEILEILASLITRFGRIFDLNFDEVSAHLGSKHVALLGFDRLVKRHVK